MTEEHTIASMPPAGNRRPGRPPTWEGTLNEARRHPGQWRRLNRSMTKNTAVQVASDLRNGVKRPPEKRRVKAVREGDVWECVWGQDPTSGKKGAHYLWIKWSPATAW